MRAEPVTDAQNFQAQNEALYQRLSQEHGLTTEQMTRIRGIFVKSGYIGQGNPKITRHPVTVEQHREKLAAAAVQYENADFEKICGAKYMAPLHNSATEKPADAKACIDQFEFPNIPCEYPVVWVRAKEAAEICEAMGKRICDAHEWEGACAGSLEAPDYRFDLAKKPAPRSRR